ncbi:MAG: hypothetical protein ABW352_07730 [Polyangiales bacterium]
MNERLTAEKPDRTFRPQVLAWRTSAPGPWSAPRLRMSGHDLYSSARARRAVRPIGLGSERLYWGSRPPQMLRGWAGRPDRLR